MGKNGPTTEAFKEAGESSCRKLQNMLDKKAKGSALDRVALRLVQGLDAKTTKFASHEGILTDSKDLIDFRARADYAKLIVDIFGAKESEKHQVDIGDKTVMEVVAALYNKREKKK